MKVSKILYHWSLLLTHFVFVKHNAYILPYAYLTTVQFLHSWAERKNQNIVPICAFGKSEISTCGRCKSKKWETH